MKQNSEILIYRTKDNEIRIETRLKDETVWLTQDQMAMLFGKAKSTINEHIKNIYAEEELEENQTLKKFGISEFQQKALNYYNLDVIISVGYRVKSNQGTQFRQWATNGRLMKMQDWIQKLDDFLKKVKRNFLQMQVKSVIKKRLIKQKLNMKNIEKRKIRNISLILIVK
ncbi:MAG: virulence RhuM family protein [Deltaproteobacteria bacterium]|jgi:hypothetical protein|nr:virulence RhuM family protein [Deltaproteobacteria bacterium]